MTERVCPSETCTYEVASQTSRWSFPEGCPQCGRDLVAPTTDTEVES
jgi:hypothetical protein